MHDQVAIWGDLVISYELFIMFTKAAVVLLEKDACLLFSLLVSGFNVAAGPLDVRAAETWRLWQSGNSMNIIYIEVETQYSLQWAGKEMKSFFLHLCISF